MAIVKPLNCHTNLIASYLRWLLQETIFRCRKCRRLVATSANEAPIYLVKEAGEGRPQFAGKRMTGNDGGVILLAHTRSTYSSMLVGSCFVPLALYQPYLTGEMSIYNCAGIKDRSMKGLSTKLL